MPTTRLGEVTITRVVEIGRSSFPTTSMLPEATPDGIARHLGWLKPSFLDEGTDDLGSRIQSYVVRTPEHTILMDTCVGNDKHREGPPAWHMRQGTFLDDLAALGVRAEDSTTSCARTCTSTTWAGTPRSWAAAGSPRSRRRSTSSWARSGSSGSTRRRGAEKDGCIADSVTPIVEAGRATLVDTTATIGKHLRFEPTPGHTPGHVCGG